MLVPLLFDHPKLQFVDQVGSERLDGVQGRLSLLPCTCVRAENHDTANNCRDRTDHCTSIKADRSNCHSQDEDSSGGDRRLRDKPELPTPLSGSTELLIFWSKIRDWY